LILLTPTKDNNTDMGEIKQIRLVVSCARGTLLRKMLPSVQNNIFITRFDANQINYFVFSCKNLFGTWTKITSFGPVDLAQWRQVALYASNNPQISI
jgi:hypothetical protein